MSPPVQPIRPPSIEEVLAQQANAAMRDGAEPQATTQALQQMVAHLRSNPQLAQQASLALAHGADPGDISAEIFQRMAGNEAVQGLQTVPGAIVRSLAQPAESFGKLISPPESEVADLNSPTNPARMALEARFGFAPKFQGVSPRERLIAGLQTVANIAAPELARIPVVGPAVAGASVGATYDPEHPFRGALIGGVMGGAVHAAPAVGESLGEAVGSDKLSPFKGRAYNLALESLGADNKPISALRAARAAYPEGTPISLADLGGRNTRLRAQSARTVSGPGADQLDNALMDRRAMQPSRIAQSVDQNMGTAGKNYFTERQNTIGQIRDEDTANYGAAVSEKPGPVTDPRLGGIMKTSAWKRAVPAAQRIAANEGVEWAPSAGGRPAEIPEDQWNLLQKAAQARGIPLPGESGPTLQQLHYVKMALDDMKDGKVGLAPDEGSGIGKTEARSVGKVQKQLLGVMDDWSDTYKQARGNSAELRGRLGAGALGRAFTQGEPEEMAATMDAKVKTPAQQDQYRVGAVRTIKGQLGRVNPGKGQYAADVPSIANNPLAQMRLAKIAPSPDAYNALGNDLGAERLMNETQQSIQGGSNTTDKALMAAQLMNRGPMKFAMKAAGGNYGGIMKAIFQDALTERAMRGASGTAAELSPLYTAGMTGENPAKQLSSIFDALEAHQAGRAKVAGDWRKGGLLAGLMSSYANGESQQP